MNPSKLIAIIISLNISSNLVCAEKGPDKYQMECQQILAKHATKLQQYKATAIHKNLIQEGLVIGQKLAQYEKNLLQQKQSALDDIKSCHVINDTAWKSCLRLINDVEQFNKDNQHLPLPNVQHDTNIPEHLLSLITERLQKGYKINPRRINILGQLKDDSLYITNSPSPHITPSSVSNVVYDKTSLFSSQNFIPGIININLDRFSQLHMYIQAALCIRMVEDIIQHIHLTPAIITDFEPLLTDNPGTIIQSSQFKALTNLCQHKLTVLLPSITNPTIAGCMLNLTINCDDHVFTQYDFNLLAKIDRWNKALAWITAS